jgi:hypothetical protein
MNGAAVVRTISAVDRYSAQYTAAQQTTDFGSPQASISHQRLPDLRAASAEAMQPRATL